MDDGLFTLVPEYVLGALPEAETRRFEAALAGSPALARAVDEAVADVAAVAERLAPVEPDAQVRARLLRTVAGVDRFAAFLARIAALVDLTVDAVRDLLERIDDPVAWEPGLPGMQVQHFAAGPRFATADAGFVRLQPGVVFPRHRHLGHEVTLVLQGHMRDGDTVYRPGDVVEMAEGSVHGFSATADRDLIVVNVHHGIVPVF